MSNFADFTVTRPVNSMDSVGGSVHQQPKSEKSFGAFPRVLIVLTGQWRHSQQQSRTPTSWGPQPARNRPTVIGERSELRGRTNTEPRTNTLLERGMFSIFHYFFSICPILPLQVNECFIFRIKIETSIVFEPSRYQTGKPTNKINLFLLNIFRSAIMETSLPRGN